MYAVDDGLRAVAHRPSVKNRPPVVAEQKPKVKLLLVVGVDGALGEEGAAFRLRFRSSARPCSLSILPPALEKATGRLAPMRVWCSEPLE